MQAVTRITLIVIHISFISILSWHIICNKQQSDINDLNAIWYSTELYFLFDALRISAQPVKTAQIARFMRQTWGTPGANRAQLGPMLAQMNLAIRGCMSCNPIFIICAQKILSGTHLRAIIPRIVQCSVKHANDPLCCYHRSIKDGLYPSMSVELKNCLVATMGASHNMVRYNTINHTIAKAWNWT